MPFSEILSARNTNLTFFLDIIKVIIITIISLGFLGYVFGKISKLTSTLAS